MNTNKHACKTPDCIGETTSKTRLCERCRVGKMPRHAAMPAASRGAWSKQARLAQTSTMPAETHPAGPEPRETLQTGEHASAAQNAILDVPSVRLEKVRRCYDCGCVLIPLETGFCRGCTSARVAMRQGSREGMGTILVPQFEQPRVLDSNTWPEWLERIAVPVGVAGVLAIIAALVALHRGVL